MTVLLVDDDEDDRDIFRDALALAKPDCKLIYAFDGEGALELLKSMETLPNYIFLDVNMPKMGGKEFLSVIKADPRFRKVNVIMYSTSSYKNELGVYLAMGATNYITKPSEFNLLVTYLKTVLH